MAYKQELWDEAKKKCRIGDEEIRMAKEMGLNPKSLITTFPPKKHRTPEPVRLIIYFLNVQSAPPPVLWKAPVRDWIHDMYDKRQRKSRQKAKRRAAGQNKDSNFYPACLLMLQGSPCL